MARPFVPAGEKAGPASLPLADTSARGLGDHLVPNDRGDAGIQLLRRGGDLRTALGATDHLLRLFSNPRGFLRGEFRFRRDFSCIRGPLSDEHLRFAR